MENFFDFYELYGTSAEFVDNYTKDQNNKECRFCGKGYPEVLFNKKPHVIPELLGKNQVTSNFECDTCNELFQKFETDFATLIQPYLALLSIKTKNGVPVFQSRKEVGEKATVIRSTSKGPELFFGTNFKDFKHDYEKKSLTIHFRTKKFRPYSIYRILLKIGISLLSENDVKQNEHYLQFLNSEKPITNGLQQWQMIRYILKTKRYSYPYANVYKAKEILVGNEAFPEYTLTLHFANIILQMFLPLSLANIESYNPLNNLRLELFPSFLIDDCQKLKAIELNPFDLFETNKVEITDKLILYYDELLEDEKES